MCEKVIELGEQNKPFAHAISTADCHFIEKPLSSIVPVLLQTLLDQEGDDSARSISMSGMTCLGLCTALCTLRRVFELLRSPACANRIFTDANLPRIVAVLAKRSKDVPQVSKEACGAIYFLAKGYESISSELSPFLSDIFDVLFSTSALAKETPFRIPTSAYAYEAFCEVVRVSNLQDYKASVAIGVLMPRVMRRLNTVLDAKSSLSGDRMNKYDLLVLLCGVLHVIIKKAYDQKVKEYCERYAKAEDVSMEEEEEEESDEELSDAEGYGEDSGDEPIMGTADP